MILPFMIMNPGVDTAEVVLGAFELEGDAVMGQLERAHLLIDRCVDLVGGAPRPDSVPAACLVEPVKRTWLAEGGELVLRGLPDLVSFRPANGRAEVFLQSGESSDQRIAVKIRPGEQVPLMLTLAVGQGVRGGARDRRDPGGRHERCRGRGRGWSSSRPPGGSAETRAIRPTHVHRRDVPTVRPVGQAGNRG